MFNYDFQNCLNTIPVDLWKNHRRKKRLFIFLIVNRADMARVRYSSGHLEMVATTRIHVTVMDIRTVYIHYPFQVLLKPGNNKLCFKLNFLSDHKEIVVKKLSFIFFKFYQV